MAENNAKRGGPGRPFAKGVSGNPGGRPKVAEEFRLKARRITDERVVDAWVEEVETRGENWMRASELLAAYGYGKPTQPVEHSGSLETLPDETLQRRLAELLASASTTATRPPEGGA